MFSIKEYKENGNVDKKDIKFTNLNEFINLTETLEPPKMLFIKSFFFNIHMNLDYFTLRYTESCHDGIVSEKLKKEIEKEGITGIEFRPIELSLNEWLMPGGERERIYGRS